MRILILGLLLIISVFAQGKTTVEGRYSESANIFAIMDHVSNWWPGFTEDVYQNYWKNRFRLSEEDLKRFKEYEALRWRYYNDPDQQGKDPLKNRNGFFAMPGKLKNPLKAGFKMQLDAPCLNTHSS